MGAQCCYGASRVRREREHPDGAKHCSWGHSVSVFNCEVPLLAVGDWQKWAIRNVISISTPCTVFERGQRLCSADE